MNSTLLSVVIPCYNAYEFLKRAIYSFEKNKTDYIEIIIVDDCSTDNSFECLQKLKDTSQLSIKILQNEINSGPGYSRNAGIKIASGKYITFLDADDWFDDDFFLEVYDYLKDEPDCIIFDYEAVYPNGRVERKSMFFSELAEGTISPQMALMYVRGATMGKIYKRSILLDNKVTFLNQKRNEDLPFTKLAISKCNKILYTKSLHYEYFQNQTSLMHDEKLLDPKNAYNAFMELNRRIEHKYYEEIEGIFILECFYSTSVSSLSFMNRRQWKEYVSNLIDMYPDFLKNKYFNSYSFRIQVFVILIYYKQFNLVKLLVKLQNWIKNI